MLSPILSPPLSPLLPLSPPFVDGDEDAETPPARTPATAAAARSDSLTCCRSIPARSRSHADFSFSSHCLLTLASSSSPTSASSRSSPAVTSSRACLSSPCCALTAAASWYASRSRLSSLARDACGVELAGERARVSAAALVANRAATVNKTRRQSNCPYENKKKLTGAPRGFVPGLSLVRLFRSGRHRGCEHCHHPVPPRDVDG